ncbi:MAG: PhzF family phenazine biosynthesis protein [Hyphomicrobiaceae bacterium]
MQLDYHTLDVFTDRRFGGNPLAVVLGADGLDTDLMQTIAREFNLSETVFVQRPVNPAHSARVRIFTPAAELPFAGHPTVGTACLLADLRTPSNGAERDALVALEQNIGTVRVGVRLTDGSAYAEFDAPKVPESAGPAPTVDQLAAALGLIPSEIGAENYRPTVYTAGVPFVFVPLASLEAVARADVHAQHWRQTFAGCASDKVFVFCRQTVHASSAFHARMFAPSLGVKEDPATGSAAAAFAGVIHQFDTFPDGNHRRVVEQGFEMGRPSLISLSVEIARGALGAVRIGGGAVRVSEGRITL